MPSPFSTARKSQIKTLKPLQIKKVRQLAQDAQIQTALLKAKQAERANDHGPTKRRTSEFLGRYIAVSLHSADALRDEAAYRARSYNAAKQVLALIDHVFVDYPVPLFLYRTVLSPEGVKLVFEDGHAKVNAKYRSWFFAVAQGRSFAKASKDVFTKREAHLFLKAPGGNRIESNILWAKAAALGVPFPGCDYLVDRLDKQFLKAVGKRLPDLLRFYAEAWPRMRGYDVDEITDYIRAMANDGNFSFKGRTYGSMRKRCALWHRTNHWGYVREYRSWPARLKEWEHRKSGIVVRAEELTNNRALSEEGNCQHHCVLTYTYRCLQGTSVIVSLRWFPEGAPHLLRDRLTIEISPAQGAIVQIRGRLNRRATDEEMKVVRLWAGVQGLTIPSYA